MNVKYKNILNFFVLNITKKPILFYSLTKGNSKNINNPKIEICNNILTKNNYITSLNKSSKFNFSENKFKKLKYNNFIKEDSKIEDLKYKEEIFEYVALKSYQMTEKEILISLEKLENFKILETELKEYKCYIRNILEITDKINDEKIVLKFIRYYLKIYEDIKIFMDKNYFSIENNSYDLNFSNIDLSMFNFSISRLHNVNNNRNIRYIIEILNNIQFSSFEIKKDFLAKIQIKFLQNINLNISNSQFFKNKFSEELKQIYKINSNDKIYFDDNYHIENDRNSNNLEIKSFVNKKIDLIDYQKNTCISLDNNKNNIDLDLLTFFWYNIAIYTQDKIKMDVLLKEIFSFFEFFLKDEFELNLFDFESPKRSRVKKLNEKELKVLNYIYGNLNNWLINFNKEIEKNKVQEKNESDMGNKKNFNEYYGKSKNEDINNDSVNAFNYLNCTEDFYSIKNFLKNIEKIILINNKISIKNFKERYIRETKDREEKIIGIEEFNQNIINKILTESKI